MFVPIEKGESIKNSWAEVGTRNDQPPEMRNMVLSTTIIVWLVVWNIFYFSIYCIGNFIIPTDELTPSFSEGLVGIPPTIYNNHSDHCPRIHGQLSSCAWLTTQPSAIG